MLSSTCICAKNTCSSFHCHYWRSLVSLQSRRSVSCLTLLHYCTMTYHSSSTTSPQCTPSDSSISTVIQARTSTYQQNYFPRAIKQWNNLLNCIIDAKILQQFIIVLLTWIYLNQPFALRVSPPECNQHLYFVLRISASWMWPALMCYLSTIQKHNNVAQEL